MKLSTTEIVVIVIFGVGLTVVVGTAILLLIQYWIRR
jgi:hypothetical protein